MLAPHGGCTWEGCQICFPPGVPYPQSWKTHEKGVKMEIDQDGTVDAVREELDNYGGHVPVIIETPMHHYYIGNISTRDISGELCVVIDVGDRID